MIARLISLLCQLAFEKVTLYFTRKLLNNNIYPVFIFKGHVIYTDFTSTKWTY